MLTDLSLTAGPKPGVRQDLAPTSIRRDAKAAIRGLCIGIAASAGDHEAPKPGTSYRVNPSAAATDASRGSSDLSFRCSPQLGTTPASLRRSDESRPRAHTRNAQKEASGSRPAMAEAGTAPGQNADCRCHEQAELSSAENRASLASALGRNEPPSWPSTSVGNGCFRTQAATSPPPAAILAPRRREVSARPSPDTWLSPRARSAALAARDAGQGRRRRDAWHSGEAGVILRARRHVRLAQQRVVNRCSSGKVWS
jgi:hypothetical protein